jgi:CheY-like chemotaxis protein
MKKVLIIEDQKEICEILEEVFCKHHGFKHATFAYDGLEGYTEAQLQKYDLICTDHSMPYFNGADMVSALRHKPGLNQDTPVIMVTASALELSSDLKNFEDTYFIEKPIDYSRLSRYIKIIASSNKKKPILNEI